MRRFCRWLSGVASVVCTPAVFECSQWQTTSQTICDATQTVTQTICDAAQTITKTICDATQTLTETVCDATQTVTNTICDKNIPVIGGLLCVLSHVVSTVVCVASHVVSTTICIASHVTSEVVCLASHVVSTVICVASHVLTSTLCIAWTLVKAAACVLVGAPARLICSFVPSALGSRVDTPPAAVLVSGVIGPGNDVRHSRDGNWRVELRAFKTSLFVYKAIGATLSVTKRELRKKFIIFGPLVMKWVPRKVQSLAVRNVYFGLLPSLTEAAAQRSCSATNASSCDCRLWAAGVGISMDASADTGLPEPGTTMPGAAASLEVRSVESTGGAVLPDGTMISLGPVSAS